MSNKSAHQRNRRYGNHSKPPAQQQPNPAAQRERAFLLYNQGLRVAAIADTLGASVATIKQWIADILNQREVLSGEGPTGGNAETTIAIEGFRAIAGVAWYLLRR